MATVSVIVLNYNGRDHLDPCFRSLLALDYPSEQVELVLADNASSDGSREWMAREFPQVRVLALERNFGFGEAYNRAIQGAQGELAVLLNNDTRVDPAMLRELVACWERRQPACAAVGAAMLGWNGGTIDFGGAWLNFHGFGVVQGHGQPYHPAALGTERPVPFACAGAMLVERQAFLDVGGFDPDFFAYFEDVDLGWRLWLAGREVYYAPAARAYHRLHGTRLANDERLWRLELNALRTIVKNYEQPTLDRVLPAAIQLAVSRAMVDAAGPAAALAPRQTPPRAIAGGALAPLRAVDELARDWPTLKLKRERVQALRRVSDADLFARFGADWLVPARLEPAYVAAHRAVVAASGLDALVGAEVSVPQIAGTRVPPAWWQLPRRALDYLRAGGFGLVWKGLRLYVRWVRDSLAARARRKARPE